MASSSKIVVMAMLFISLAMKITLWSYSYDVRSQWVNIPPPVDKPQAKAFMLGDAHLAYRVFSIFLQNTGDIGRKGVSLELYDYENLKGWFFLESDLDKKSNFIPFLAAFYYGAIGQDERLAHILEYLRYAGKVKAPEKWRWLAQAVYIAQYELKDLGLALSLAYELAELPDDKPIWANQMPAFILNAKGDKKEALVVMMKILQASVDEIHPNEVLSIRDYICRNLLTQDSQDLNSLCEGL